MVWKLLLKVCSLTCVQASCKKVLDKYVECDVMILLLDMLLLRLPPYRHLIFNYDITTAVRSMTIMQSSLIIFSFVHVNTSPVAMEVQRSPSSLRGLYPSFLPIKYNYDNVHAELRFILWRSLDCSTAHTKQRMLHVDLSDSVKMQAHFHSLLLQSIIGTFAIIIMIPDTRTLRSNPSLNVEYIALLAACYLLVKLLVQRPPKR